MKMSRMILIAFLCGFVISGGLIVKAVLFDGKQASGIDPASVSASQDPAGTAEAGGNQSTNPDEQSSAFGDPVASASADATSAGISASPPGSSDAASPSPGNSVSTSPNAAKTPAAGTITLAQLKAANGQNGSPAYVAYHGIVYSVSEDPAFINGIHRYNKNIKAGMDLTFLFDQSAPGSHRVNDYISRFILIGVMDPSYAGPDPNFILPGGGDDD